MRSSLLICVALACSLGGCRREPRVAKGDELYSILDEAVLQVSLRGPDKRATAQRSTNDQPFHYRFEGGKRGARQCPARAELDQALDAVHEIRVSDVLDPDQAARVSAANGKGWSELEIYDFATNSEPFRLRLLADAAHPGRAYAQLPGRSDVMLVDGALLHLLELDCPQ